MTLPCSDPARQRIEQDLASADFEAGAGAGHWRLLSLDWPHLIVTVTCGDGNALGLRIMVDGYPRLAPSGRPWDLVSDEALPSGMWPEGGTVPEVFRRDWSRDNGDAPYLACDRTGGWQPTRAGQRITLTGPGIRAAPSPSTCVKSIAGSAGPPCRRPVPLRDPRTLRPDHG